ncbi:MAG: hypothetical protein HY069_03155 [Chlamydiia bacterium]|nr:hypothetical protein [Chlamydiia bacterium]
MYTERDSKIGRCQGGAPILSQAKPASKQLNLNKLSNADGLKSGGCPTPAEPIFESRSVYDTGISSHKLTPTRFSIWLLHVKIELGVFEPLRNH